MLNTTLINVTAADSSDITLVVNTASSNYRPADVVFVTIAGDQ
jgi:hypothetical protein